MDDQSNPQKCFRKWGLSCFRKPDRQPRLPPNPIPPDAEPPNPIPPDAEPPNPIPPDPESPNPIPPDPEVFSQPQSSSGEEEAPILEEDELHPEWPKMDERLEEILEEKSTRLLDYEFNQLTEIQRKCLLCFSVFEPNSIIKKQNMIYWWIGECFDNTSQTREEDGEQNNITREEDGGQNNITREEDGEQSNITREEDGEQNNITREEDGEQSNITREEDGEQSNITRAEDREQSNITREEDGEQSNIAREEDGEQNNIAREEDGEQKNITTEEDGEQIFRKLAELGFIEPIGNSCTDTIHECRVQPFVHWMVKKKAREASFCDLDERGKPSAKQSKSPRLCLTSETLPEEVTGAGKTKEVTVMFNVSKQSYRSQFYEFPINFKSLVVLQLGRWSGDARYHIEVEGFENFKNIGLLTNLRYLGLQGLSRLTTLPPEIKKLKCLLILDLRGCQYLEKVGEDATYLETLTRLDLTECYMLEHIAAGFGSLSELQVFKGFVFGGSRDRYRCRLAELVKLKKLKKLSINITSEANIDTDEMNVLSDFQSVRSLTITWGAIPTIDDSETNSILKKWNALKLQLPSSIEKFDMRCFPCKEMPNWFAGLEKLERLYIRGGKLKTLCPENGSSVKYDGIKILRLKYLAHFHMEWANIRGMMPKLDRLEFVECGQFQSPPPLDENHVWIRDEKDEENDHVPPVAPVAPSPTTPETAPDETTMGDDATEAAAAAFDEEITTEPGKGKSEPAFPVSPTNEITTGTAAASNEETTPEPALQDLSAASTSAVANTTNNSSTSATIETTSNPGVVPATSPPGAAIGDEEGNPFPTSR